MNPTSASTARPPPRPLGASQQPNLPILSTPTISRQTVHDSKQIAGKASSISPAATAGSHSWSNSRNDDLAARKRDSGTTTFSEQAEDETERDDAQLLDIADGSFGDSVEIGDLSLAESADKRGREFTDRSEILRSVS